MSATDWNTVHLIYILKIHEFIILLAQKGETEREVPHPPNQQKQKIPGGSPRLQAICWALKFQLVTREIRPTPPHPHCPLIMERTDNHQASSTLNRKLNLSSLCRVGRGRCYGCVSWRQGPGWNASSEKRILYARIEERSLFVHGCC